VVSSSGSGELRARIGRDRSPFEYTLSCEELEGMVTQAHIHAAQKGVKGGRGGGVWLFAHRPCQTLARRTRREPMESYPLRDPRLWHHSGGSGARGELRPGLRPDSRRRPEAESPPCNRAQGLGSPGARDGGRTRDPQLGNWIATLPSV
jgi:hypothetical protein